MERVRSGDVGGPQSLGALLHGTLSAHLAEADCLRDRSTIASRRSRAVSAAARRHCPRRFIRQGRSWRSRRMPRSAAWAMRWLSRATPCSVVRSRSEWRTTTRWLLEPALAGAATMLAASAAMTKCLFIWVTPGRPRVARPIVGRSGGAREQRCCKSVLQRCGSL